MSQPQARINSLSQTPPKCKTTIPIVLRENQELANTTLRQLPTDCLPVSALCHLYLGPASDEVPARPTQGGDEAAPCTGHRPGHWEPKRGEVSQGAGVTHRPLCSNKKEMKKLPIYLRNRRPQG